MKHQKPEYANAHRNTCRNWSVEPGTTTKGHDAVYLRLGRNFVVFLHPTTATAIANALIDVQESGEPTSYKHPRIDRYYAIAEQISINERKAT